MVRYDFSKRYQSVSEVLKDLNSPRQDPGILDNKYPGILDNKCEILRASLKAKNWKESDPQTTNLILREAGREQEGFLDMESIEQFPCEVLRKIDDLWME